MSGGGSNAPPNSNSIDARASSAHRVGDNNRRLPLGQVSAGRGRPHGCIISVAGLMGARANDGIKVSQETYRGILFLFVLLYCDMCSLIGVCWLCFHSRHHCRHRFAWMSARQGEFGLENPTHEKGVCNAIILTFCIICSQFDRQRVKD
jgi:hypothetical protein